MRIRLTMNIPVSAAEGMTYHREFETIDTPEGKYGIWVQGDVSPVRLWNGEFEIITDLEEIEEENNAN